MTRERGFTLLELLITLAITSVGIAGLLALHGSVVRGNDGAGRVAEAQQIANATLEGLRAQRIGDMVTTLTGSVASSPPIDITLSAQTGRTGWTFRRRALVEQMAASASLWRVRVEVAWSDDNVAPGGPNDHLIAVEVVRTIEEAL